MTARASPANATAHVIRAAHVALAIGVCVGAALGVPAQAAAQRAATLRPIPAPVVPPRQYRRALAAGTRTPDGRPGSAYWQNHATYRIEARLDPATAHLEGHVAIEYRNASPDTLRQLYLHLYQNLHAPGVVRNEAQEITGGVTLHRVSVSDTQLSDSSARGEPGYRIAGTVMVVRPPAPVPPQGTVPLDLTWEVTLPRSGSGRMGYSDHQLYFVGYWFPKMAVYDDLRGWDAQPYIGTAEFYDGFGDYDVSLTVPAGWTVMATGALENPWEVYTTRTRERLHRAAASDDVITIASTEELANGGVTVESPSEWLTYRFTARNVRDFAWTTSNVQRWDATSAVVPDRDGDGQPDRVLIQAFWREARAPLWSHEAEYAKQAIEHHSRFTGFAYPWPHMTSVEGAGIIGGGMEFPMLTLMGAYTGRRPENLFGVTAHELGHMWIPMIVGSNENRHAWMDEGSTQFLEDQAFEDLYSDSHAHADDEQSYLQVARMGLEKSMMRAGDWYGPGPGYGIASYAKPATLMVALREVLGQETWSRAYRSFIAEWAFKYPTPWDLFATFERFAGLDLDWFWTSYYYETWTLDQAVGGVTSREGRPVITVEDRGFAPMPTRLRIETTNGGTVERSIPVEHWLDGYVRAEVELPEDVGEILRVEIDPGGLMPDVDRTNNVWKAGPRESRVPGTPPASTPLRRPSRPLP